MIFQLSAIAIVLILLILGISKWKLHPFMALILAAIVLGLTLGFGGEKTVDVLLTGFSKTLQWIAVVVILGALIGEILEETGGSFRISEQIVNLVGIKKIPWAMGITGYIISIPIFVDVAYILFHPIVEALSKRSKIPVLVVGLCLASGLTVSHTLMPPTPGPLAVASLLNVNLGRLILINSIVAIFSVVGGILWVKVYCKNYILPFDKQINQHKDFNKNKETAILQEGNVFKDILPIIVPVVLMAIGSFVEMKEHNFGKILQFISTPMIAVLIGVGISVLNYKKSNLNTLVESAIIKSALVIMITGAGGAFGAIIRESGVQESLGIYFASATYLGFVLPFLFAAILTTATGSITVSLIGTASVLGSMTDMMSYSPEIMAALIGCGSFCVFHANSSFFWLLNRLHNVPIKILYKTFSIQSLVMGISGFIGVVILYALGLD